MKKATGKTAHPQSPKKTTGKIPFYAHLLTTQQAQEIVGGMTLKYPSDKEETNRTSDL